jgi:uncharacterized membrane protein YgcG
MKYIVVIYLSLITFSTAALALDVPTLHGHVNDYASMVSPEVAKELETTLTDFERSESTQIVVLTIPTLEGESLEDYSIKVAEAWRIGQKKVDNGVILLIAKQERKIRIEVGRGLEGKLTDLVAGRIIRSEIAPRFKTGDINGGAKAGISAIMAVVNGEYKTQGGPLSVAHSGWSIKPVYTVLIFLALVCIFFCAVKFIKINRQRVAENLKLQQEQEAKQEAKQEVERQAQIKNAKFETRYKNKEYTERYYGELSKIKQYYINIGMSYRSNDRLVNLIKLARSKDMEVLTENHDLIMQIEECMSGIRENMQLVESAYNKHKSRTAKFTGRKMAIYENASARKLTTLLHTCAFKPELLSDMVDEDFRQTDSYQFLQQVNEYDFITGNAKKLQSSLKQRSLNTLKHESVADIFFMYTQLNEIMVMIETSTQALFNAQIADIDIIHKDWNGYYTKLKAGQC